MKTNISILAREELRACFHSPKPHHVSVFEMLKRPINHHGNDLEELVEPTITNDMIRKPSPLLQPSRKTLPNKLASRAPDRRQLPEHQDEKTDNSTRRHAAGYEKDRNDHSDQEGANEDDDDSSCDDVRESRSFHEAPFISQRRAVFGNKPKLMAQRVVRPLPDDEMARRVVFTGKADVSQRPESILARKRGLLLV